MLEYSSPASAAGSVAVEYGSQAYAFSTVGKSSEDWDFGVCVCARVWGVH